jgi:hypothetical protein
VTDFKAVYQTSHQLVDNFVDSSSAGCVKACKIKGFPGMPKKMASEEIVQNQALTCAIGFVATPDGLRPPHHIFCV